MEKRPSFVYGQSNNEFRMLGTLTRIIFTSTAVDISPQAASNLLSRTLTC